MNVLLIGMGMVAQTHVLALRDSVIGARLSGALGRDKARVSAFCDRAGRVLGHLVPAYDDIASALAALPDIAIVITPPDARSAYATALAQAGVPTLMEKPIERTLDNARQIVDAYKRANVPLGLCFQHRTRYAARALKSRLDLGELGHIVHVDIRVPWWRDQTYYDAPGRGTYARDGGGVMINQAIHTLDLALWFAGPVRSLQAHMRTSPLHVMQAEDIASALLTFASGATGVLSASTAAYPGTTESITLTTSCAQVLLQGDTLHIDWHNGRTAHITPSLDDGTGSGADPMAFSHAQHQSLIEDFVTAVRSGYAPMVPGAEALCVHAVIDAMTQAARTGASTQVAL